jgi:hypothetical protein
MNDVGIRKTLKMPSRGLFGPSPIPRSTALPCRGLTRGFFGALRAATGSKYCICHLILKRRDTVACKICVRVSHTLDFISPADPGSIL